MHIAEGYLPVAHAVGWTAVAAPFVAYGGYRLVKHVREHPEDRILVGASGAFVFVLSAIKLPSATGSSSHPTGTGLGTVLFKPPIMAVMAAMVLVFQALLLAHGGLTTLGANVMSMGVAGPWIGYAAYVLVRKVTQQRDVAVFVCMVLANLATYVVTSCQLGLAYPDATSGIVGGVAKYLGIFAVTQIPLALAEGFVGVVVFRLLADFAPRELTRLGLITSPTSQDLQEAGR